MKAFAYMRCSGLAQVSGDTWDRQLETIQKYAERNGMEITEVFREEGLSGTTEIAGRKALPALLAALESNGVRTVIIEKLDRIARDLMTQETIIGDMRKRGFTLISALEPDLCSNDPSRVMMRQIFGAIAQYDKTMIVLKLNAARERKRARGERAEGALPYGEKEGEKNCLERMLELKLAGLNLREITEKINKEGFKSRSGREWHLASIHKILKRAK